MPIDLHSPPSKQGLPALSTERLRLVPYGAAPATVEAYCEITTDPAVYWWQDPPYTAAQQTDYFNTGKLWTAAERGMGYWAVFEHKTDAVLGQVILQLLEETGLIEIGWHFLERARGHGYATEAAARLLAHGFDVAGVDPIYAVIRPSNEPSIQVAVRIGMRPDGQGTYYGHPHLRFRLTRSLHASQQQDLSS